MGFSSQSTDRWEKRFRHKSQRAKDTLAVKTTGDKKGGNQALQKGPSVGMKVAAERRHSEREERTVHSHILPTSSSLAGDHRQLSFLMQPTTTRDNSAVTFLAALVEDSPHLFPQPCLPQQTGHNRAQWLGSLCLGSLGTGGAWGSGDTLWPGEHRQLLEGKPQRRESAESRITLPCLFWRLTGSTGQRWVEK